MINQAPPPRQYVLVPIAAAQECQFCLETDGEIIKPCSCRFAHRKCLDEWRVHHKNDAAFHACEICRFQYELEPHAETYWQQNSRALLLALCLVWDMIVLVALVESGSCLAAFVLRLCDSSSHALADSISTQHHLLAYWLWGHLLFFFVAGIIVMCSVACGGSTGGGRGGGGARTNFYFIDCFDCCGGGGSSDCGECGIWILGILFLAIVMIGWLAIIWTACEWLSTRWSERTKQSRRWIEARGQQVRNQVAAIVNIV